MNICHYLIMTYYLMNTDIYHPTNFIHLIRKKLVPDCINRLNISSHQPQPDETMKNVGNKSNDPIILDSSENDCCKDNIEKMKLQFKNGSSTIICFSDFQMQ